MYMASLHSEDIKTSKPIIHNETIPSFGENKSNVFWHQFYFKNEESKINDNKSEKSEPIKITKPQKKFTVINRDLSELKTAIVKTSSQQPLQINP